MSQIQYRQCPHNLPKIYVAIYNTGESPIILCQECFSDSGFVNKRDCKSVIDTRTNKEVQF